MQVMRIIKASYKILLYVVLGLAVLALVAEVLPEAESKIIVIPTLVLMIVVSILGLGLWKKEER